MEWTLTEKTTYIQFSLRTKNIHRIIFGALLVHYLSLKTPKWNTDLIGSLNKKKKERKRERKISRPIVFINTLIFNCYLAAPRPTLGHCRGDRVTHPMLITAFVQFRPIGCLHYCRTPASLLFSFLLFFVEAVKFTNELNFCKLSRCLMSVVL